MRGNGQVPRGSAVRAIVCDLGGVVIRIDPDRIRARWAAMSRLSAAEASAAYPDEVYYGFERGDVSESEYLEHVRGRLQLQGTDEAILAAFNDLYLGTDEITLGVLQRLRERGVLVVALTNTNVSHQRVWSRRFAPALKVFHRVYCSHELGSRKPEPGVFHAVLSRHDLAPADAVFVDDVPDYVHAAETVGLTGIVFTDGPALSSQLATFVWDAYDVDRRERGAGVTRRRQR